MAVDHVKATQITNWDATPRVQGTAGENGAPGLLRISEGYATAVASSSEDATYQLVRLPSTAKVKRIIFESEAQGAGKFDIGAYYATDGSSSAGAASLLAAAAIDQDFFASVIDCAAAVLRTDITNESTTYTLAKRQMPLWQALGLTSDPGGNIDIVATVKTTAVTTGTGKFGISVEWVP
jgi:hypothetical protein